jgi:ATP-binding cassette subfamily C protein CydD
MSREQSRLVRRVPRRSLVALAVLAVLRAGAVVAQAFLLARLVVAGFDGRPVARTAVLLAVALAVRALVAGTTEVVARGTSSRLRQQVRRDVLTAAVRRGPAWLTTPQGQQLPVLAGPGIDGLDGWVSSYLPLVLQCVVVPPAVLLGVGVADPWSLLVLALCLPLLPVFLALVGMHTRRQTDDQLRGLARLAEHFLDVLVGLPTLRVFGRDRRQLDVLRRMADDHRGRTLVVLRTAFLSALVLELLATLSVALVALSLGFRLLEGSIDLQPALTVLLLAPEAFAPLRGVGAAYHAGAAGLSVEAEVEAVLDGTPPVVGGRQGVTTGASLVLDGVVVQHPGRPPVRLDLHVTQGETVVLQGPSGCGKSTAVGVLMGLLEPTAGRVVVGGVDLADLDLEAWRGRVSWVPQRPHLFAGTLEENIRMARPDATDAQLLRAVEEAQLAEVVLDLPDGLGTRVGDRGLGLSAGQVRRVALARAFLRDADVVLLDEPTADLDIRSEVAVAEAVRRLCADRTALVTSHRASPFLDGARQVDLGLVPA